MNLTIQTDGGKYSGPEPCGPTGRALFRRLAPLLAKSGVLAAVETGRVSDAVYLLMGHSEGERALLSVLDGWTVDGKGLDSELLDEILEDPARRLEPWGPLLEVMITAGFFGETMRKSLADQKAKAAAKKKADSQKKKPKT